MRWLSPHRRGFAGGLLLVVFFSPCFWPILTANSAPRPSVAILLAMVATGASFLIAYSIQTASILSTSHARDSLQQTMVGGVVGVAACGLLGIFACLYLAARQHVGGWNWVEDLQFSFAFSSLTFLGVCIVLLPYLRYEWDRLAKIGFQDDD